MADITYIPIRQLHPHPDNPRKELGDLSELAASIKENGVYQNLTVIPGHYLSSREYISKCVDEGGDAAAAAAACVTVRVHGLMLAQSVPTNTLQRGFPRKSQMSLQIRPALARFACMPS